MWLLGQLRRAIQCGSGIVECVPNLLALENKHRYEKTAHDLSSLVL